LSNQQLIKTDIFIRVKNCWFGVDRLNNCGVQQKGTERSSFRRWRAW